MIISKIMNYVMCQKSKTNAVFSEHIFHLNAREQVHCSVVQDLFSFGG